MRDVLRKDQSSSSVLPSYKHDVLVMLSRTDWLTPISSNSPTTSSKISPVSSELLNSHSVLTCGSKGRSGSSYTNAAS